MDCGPWRVCRCPTPGYSTGSASLAQNVKAQGGRGSTCPECSLPPRAYLCTHSMLSKVYLWLIILGASARDILDQEISPLPGLAGLVFFKFAGHLANALWSNCTICQPPFLAAWCATVSMLGNAPHLPTRGSQPNLKTDPETNKRILPWETNKN